MIRTDIQNWQPVKFNDQPKVEGQKEKIDGTNLEETLFATNGQFCVGDRPIISPPLRIEIDINEFFDTKDLESLKMLFGLPENSEVDTSKVAKRRDGKITDFYVDGKRYAVRYDESGKIEKTLVMEFNENGNVSAQKIKNYNEDGKLENTLDYEYTNNGNQISQTRTARSAQYGTTGAVMSKCFGFDFNTIPDDVKYDQEGRITDITYGSKTYSFRYDENGNVSKALEMKRDENGNVTNQQVKNYNADGSLKNTIDYEYTYNGDEVSQTRTARSAEFGDVPKVMVQYFGFALKTIPDDVKYDQEGRITDITYGSKTYSFRYDENGNVSKALEMKHDENGNVTNQQVKNYNADGSLKNTIDYEYTYNGDEVSQTRTARSAEFGDVPKVMVQYFGFALYTLPDDVKYDQEGRITDINIAGKRYSLRYGENGEVEKTIIQTFHENGNVATQKIETMLHSGWLGDDSLHDYYLYDENGNQISHEQMMEVRNYSKNEP